MNEQENEVEELEQQAQHQDTLERNTKYFWRGLLTGLGVALLIGCGTYLVQRGYLIYQSRKIQTAAVETGTEASEDTEAVNDKTMNKLSVIEGVISNYYYKDDYEVSALEDGMYRGLVEALGDPYSDYYSKDDLNELMEESAGTYEGIGAYLGMDKELGVCRIAGIMQGTPAEEAGLRENDIIYQVEDTVVGNMDSTEVVKLLRGEAGTAVKMTVYRESSKEYVDVEIERKDIEVPTVNSEMFENGIGYIQITEFDTVTTNQFTNALTELKSQDMKGLVLDLRANPGGNVVNCVDIARLLLPKGVIVYTEDRDGNRTDYECDGENELHIPMVVLVNGYSASASEILAGAIKDYEKGTLLGTTTYGKGIVQKVISLSDGTAVKLTVYSYFTPKGNNIHGIGIEPDEVCEFDADAYYNNDYDNQLERAKEILQEKLSE